MTDPLTMIVVAAGGTILSKDILNKLLGPTADYLGGATKDVVERSAKNLMRIFEVACGKLKEKVHKKGQVNSRILKGVVDEGLVIEDVFSAEYFGGILASARTADGQDDTAIPMLALVKSLSADQLRLHFIIYYLVATHQFQLKETEGIYFWHGLELQIQNQELMDAMGLKDVDSEARLLLAINGLIDERLIGDEYGVRIGTLEAGKTDLLADDGLIVKPNRKGASLFLRSLGLRGLHPEVITNVDPDYSLSDAVKSAVTLPQNGTIRERHVSDAFKVLQSDVADKLSDVESVLEELQDKIDELESNLAEKKNDDSSEDGS